MMMVLLSSTRTSSSLSSSSYYATLLIGFLQVSNCFGRTWLDVLDPVLYATAVYDPARTRFLVESDPFAFPINNNNNNNNVAAPVSSPTSAPTNLYVVDNCAVGEHPYMVKMHDTWGDGWDASYLRIIRVPDMESVLDNNNNDTEGSGFQETMTTSTTTTGEGDKDVFTITEKVDVTEIFESRGTVVFDGTLQKGWDENAHVCLQHEQCYHVIAGEGLWTNEIHWEITPMNDDESQVEKNTGGNHNQTFVAKGIAPMACRFSIPGMDGRYVCEQSCDLEFGSGSSKSPTYLHGVSVPPSDMPSLVPSSNFAEQISPGGSNFKSAANGNRIPGSTNTVSRMPSDVPSLVPTQVS